MQNLKLSILDLCYFTENDNSATDVLNNSTTTAQLAEKLGYNRYWFAEHHNTGSLMSMFPEVMIAHVAANTKHIRVGSGGVMLPNHSSLSVAERFSMLEALHPGRIDLGLGRAPGTDGRTAYALRRSWEIMKGDTFPEQLNDLLHYFGHDFPEKHPFETVIASPDPSLTPEIYLLGSSNGGVNFALEKGLGFVFAAQINADMAVPVLNYYRNNFQPSKYYNEPKSMMSISVFTADTEEEALYLAEPTILMWTLLGTNKRITKFPTIKQASEYSYTSQELAIREHQMNKFVIGTPSQVAEKLTYWAKRTQVDEIILVEGYHDIEARKKGYTLLAKEFGISK